MNEKFGGSNYANEKKKIRGVRVWKEQKAKELKRE